jgi:hypothetical protein
MWSESDEILCFNVIFCIITFTMVALFDSRLCSEPVLLFNALDKRKLNGCYFSACARHTKPKPFSNVSWMPHWRLNSLFYKSLNCRIRWLRIDIQTDTKEPLRWNKVIELVTYYHFLIKERHNTIILYYNAQEIVIKLFLYENRVSILYACHKSSKVAICDAPLERLCVRLSKTGLKVTLGSFMRCELQWANFQSNNVGRNLRKMCRLMRLNGHLHQQSRMPSA